MAKKQSWADSTSTTANPASRSAASGKNYHRAPPNISHRNGICVSLTMAGTNDDDSPMESIEPASAAAQKPEANANEEMLTDIEQPHSNDVLCGRGVTTNKFPGNEKFRSLVSLNKELYVTSSKRQKMAISRSIVQAVRSLSPPGRFLEKNPETGLWSDVGEKKAIEKTSQALRDGAASLRKQLSEDLRNPDFLSAVFDDADLSAIEAVFFGESANSKCGASSTASPMDMSANSRRKAKEKALKEKPVKRGHRRIKSNPEPSFNRGRINLSIPGINGAKISQVAAVPVPMKNDRTPIPEAATVTPPLSYHNAVPVLHGPLGQSFELEQKDDFSKLQHPLLVQQLKPPPPVPAVLPLCKSQSLPELMEQNQQPTNGNTATTSAQQQEQDLDVTTDAKPFAMPMAMQSPSYAIENDDHLLNPLADVGMESPFTPTLGSFEIDEAMMRGGSDDLLGDMLDTEDAVETLVGIPPTPTRPL